MLRVVLPVRVLVDSVRTSLKDGFKHDALKEDSRERVRIF